MYINVKIDRDILYVQGDTDITDTTTTSDILLCDFQTNLLFI